MRDKDWQMSDKTDFPALFDEYINIPHDFTFTENGEFFMERTPTYSDVTSAPSINFPQSTVNSESNTTALSKDDMKRIKNTEAARLSRKRKTDKMQHLEEQVTNLSTRNNELEKHNFVLRNENAGCICRIKALEKQISELHGVIVSLGTRTVDCSNRDGEKCKLQKDLDAECAKMQTESSFKCEFQDWF